MNGPHTPIRSLNTGIQGADGAGGPSARPRSITASGNRPRGAAGEQATPPTSLEMIGEVADLMVGVGMLTLTLAPFAVPALALTALVALVLLIPAVVIALPLAPFVLARRYWRSRDRTPSAAGPARSDGGDKETRTRTQHVAAGPLAAQAGALQQQQGYAAEHQGHGHRPRLAPPP